MLSMCTPALVGGDRNQKGLPPRSGNLSGPDTRYCPLTYEFCGACKVGRVEMIENIALLILLVLALAAFAAGIGEKK